MKPVTLVATLVLKKTAGLPAAGIGSEHSGGDDKARDDGDEADDDVNERERVRVGRS